MYNIGYLSNIPGIRLSIILSLDIDGLKEKFSIHLRHQSI